MVARVEDNLLFPELGASGQETIPSSEVSPSNVVEVEKAQWVRDEGVHASDVWSVFLSSLKTNDDYFSCFNAFIPWSTHNPRLIYRDGWFC